jgi:helix-turn-helix, Psq domain
MDKAYTKVVEEDWSVARAARTYGVPFSTLHNKLTGSHKTGDIGRPTYLTRVEEEAIVGLLVLMGQYNYPVTKRKLQDMVKSYLDRDSRYG